MGYVKIKTRVWLVTMDIESYHFCYKVLTPTEQRFFQVFYYINPIHRPTESQQQYISRSKINFHVYSHFLNQFSTICKYIKISFKLSFLEKIAGIDSFNPLAIHICYIWQKNSVVFTLGSDLIFSDDFSHSGNIPLIWLVRVTNGLSV